MVFEWLEHRVVALLVSHGANRGFKIVADACRRSTSRDARVRDGNDFVHATKGGVCGSWDILERALC